MDIEKRKNALRKAFEGFIVKKNSETSLVVIARGGKERTVETVYDKEEFGFAEGEFAFQKEDLMIFVGVGKNGCGCCCGNPISLYVLREKDIKKGVSHWGDCRADQLIKDEGLKLVE